LSLASSATDVSDTCLEHALAAVGAEAGYVVLQRAGGATIEIASHHGYTEQELDTWRTLDLESDAPASRAFASGEPVWALATNEMAAFKGVEPGPDVGWVSLPLRSHAGVRGALHLSFRAPRAERSGAPLVAGRRRAVRALERSMLFDEEQRLRERSERLQEMTAALSNALTRADVAEAVVAARRGAGADGTSLAIVLGDRKYPPDAGVAGPLTSSSTT
jgi:hypothetical protein